jgi:hypothetical protein
MSMRFQHLGQLTGPDDPEIRRNGVIANREADPDSEESLRRVWCKVEARSGNTGIAGPVQESAQGDPSAGTVSGSMPSSVWRR